MGAVEQPAAVDLREWASPVQFQGGFQTCAAHAGASLVAYFAKKRHGKDVRPSRLFLYKVAKSFLVNGTEDSGVYIRQVMGVLKLVGVPPEHCWPYPDPGTLARPSFSDPLLDAEPTPDCFAIASQYRVVNYRLEEDGQQPDELLHTVKTHLADHVPFAFDFPLHASTRYAQRTGCIPFLPEPEPILANHAVVAMGYDDAIEIGDGVPGACVTRGALLIRNSWSEQWGEGGYGWLPYAFVLAGRCRDFWTLLWSDRADPSPFEFVA